MSAPLLRVKAMAPDTTREEASFVLSGASDSGHPVVVSHGNAVACHVRNCPHPVTDRRAMQGPDEAHARMEWFCQRHIDFIDDFRKSGEMESGPIPE